MSERIDFLTYLKAKLNNELITNPDAPAVQTVRRLVSSATDIADEHFNQLALFVRSSPKLMLAVQALNDAVAAGTSPPQTSMNISRFWPPTCRRNHYLPYVLCGGPLTF
jgi:hypothetical protein